MSIHSALFDLLSTDAGVSALVASRIYPTLIPQDTQKPAIAYNQISEFPVDALIADTDILKSRFQIDCIDPAFDDAKAVGAAVIAAVQRYQGTNDSTDIIDIEYNNRVDFYDDDSDLFRDTIDIIITYRG